MPRTHCTEFARAGAGLPPIEPGMPDPAGTGLSRRAFLLRAAGAAVSVYGGAALGPQALSEGIAAAAEGDPAPVLVNVFFSGGLDSIAVVGPYGSGRLHDLRPSLAGLGGRTPAPFTGASGWFWHPDAEPLRELYADGRLAVIPSVGYTDPNQSHFTSRHFWEIGATDLLTRTGWLGRFLDLDGVGSLTNPLQGITLGQSLMPALAAERMPVAAVEDPRGYVFRTEGVWELEARMHQAMAQMATTPSGGDPVMAQAKAAQANASNLQTGLRTLPDDPYEVVYPPTQFGSRLRHLAHMLDQGLPIRTASLIANGDFDTHASQARGFTDHLPNATQALATFQADLEDRGIADRVLTFVWSEFGRRPEENGSGGTDHGASAIAFVMGTRAAGRVAGGRSGVVGAMPDIAQAALDQHGNIRHDVDFRDVYGSLLEQWLGADAERVVQGPGGRAPQTSLPLVA